MANQVDPMATWLPVIGRSLAYICLQLAQKQKPEKLDSVLKQAKFLEGFGLSRAEAAAAVGSSSASIRILEDRVLKARGKKNGKGKKKSRGQRRD